MAVAIDLSMLEHLVGEKSAAGGGGEGWARGRGARLSVLARVPELDYFCPDNAESSSNSDTDAID